MAVTNGDKEMKPTQLSIASDFSVYPGGRTPDDGPDSGQEFREKFLIPAIVNNQRVQIDFTGTRGYGSSFLEEAFGGLVRAGYTEKQILATFDLMTLNDNPSVPEEVIQYIQDAELRSKP